jgi:predicted Ser/Thr protein kinase
MANIQLSIPYKTFVTTRGRLLAWALWPVWAVLAPVCILITLGAIAVYPAIFSPMITTCLLAIPALLILVGSAFTALAQDDTLYISKEGMYFPRLLALSIGLAKYVPWDRLARADIDESGQNLRLLLRPSGTVDVPLKGVDEQQLEQFLLAIELWADRCEMTPQLVAHQHEVQNAVKGVERVSYTQLWEQELASRFTPTTFVPLEPGAALQNGKFKVVRQLSFGGFSAVYLVRDEVGKFLVAKEAVVPGGTDSTMRDKAAEHFRREAKILSQLSHPGIARVFDHFAEGGRNYILLEHIEGENLRQRVNQRGIPAEKDIIRWAVELAEIVDYLHEQSPPILHRDLTPDNVMIAPDGRLVLIDFGAANHFVEEALGTLVGKQAYMPPEQLRGQATIRSDYYSYGGTLHFLLTGRDPQPLAQNHPGQQNTEVAPKLDALVAQLTAFDESERAPNLVTLRAVVASALDKPAAARVQ